MAARIRLRGDLSSEQVRAFSRSSKDAAQVRRLLAIATILDGGSRSEAARIAGVTLQIIRDWVLRFNEAGVDGLATRKAPGPKTILDDRHRRALEEIIAIGPIPAVHGVVRWRIITWYSGCGTSSRCQSASKHWAMSCAPWATASSRLGPAIAGNGPTTLSFLKRVRRPSGANPQEPSKRNGHRAVVAG